MNQKTESKDPQYQSGIEELSFLKVRRGSRARTIRQLKTKKTHTPKCNARRSQEIGTPQKTENRAKGIRQQQEVGSAKRIRNQVAIWQRV